MHRLLIALMCALGSIVAVAATPDAALNAPIQQFIDSFNHGDAKGAAAAHSGGDLSIIDEVPPFLWQGRNAFKAWNDDLAADATKNGITDQWVALGEVVRQESAGDRAYVVVKAVYTFKQNGTPMREAAQMTFALRKEDGAWHIGGWAWTGPRAQPQ